MSRQLSILQKAVRGTMVAAMAMMVFPAAAARSQTDDWPIRLTLGESQPAIRNQWVVRAENLADFPCTKLELKVTIVGGALLSGGGQSRAKLLDDMLVYEMVPMLPAGQAFEWSVDFSRTSDRSPMTIHATLEYAEKQTAKPTPKKECGKYVPTVGKDMTVAELAFPTGSRSTSALLVHQVMPREVERNQPYTYEYHVTNLSTGHLQNVELQASGFHNLSTTKSVPAWETYSDGLRWMVGDLDACETIVIKVNAASPETGNASACLSASFSNRLCAMTNVVEPGLKLAKSAPYEALICDEIELTLTVSNPGTGIARAVHVTDELPEGLTTIDGRRKFTADVGDLGAGQSKQVKFRAKAAKVGEFASHAVARASNNLTAESNETTTTFRRPVLEIACAAPEQRYIGRGAAFEFEVRNTGDAPAANTIVKAGVPSGAETVTVSRGGTAGRGEVTWNLGTIAPGSVQTFGFEMRIAQAGTLQVAPSATATCADAVKANCQTRVIGIPAILLEVVDLDDPVEIGKQTTFVITVTNQGTAPGTNIRVGCEIPTQFAYVSSTGASTGTAAGNRITFAPIASLAPKQRVEFRVVLSAKTAGDARIGVELTSDQFSTPVRETESTNVYK